MDFVEHVPQLLVGWTITSLFFLFAKYQGKEASVSKEIVLYFESNNHTTELTSVLFNNSDECFLLIFFLMTFVPKDKFSTSPRKEDKSVCFEVRRMVVSSTEHTYK